jgi:serine/threonine protein kinase
MWKMKFVYKIYHNDIKPKNIFKYKENWYVIADFGTAE